MTIWKSFSSLWETCWVFCQFYFSWAYYQNCWSYYSSKMNSLRDFFAYLLPLRNRPHNHPPPHTAIVFSLFLLTWTLTHCCRSSCYLTFFYPISSRSFCRLRTAKTCRLSHFYFFWPLSLRTRSRLPILLDRTSVVFRYCIVLSFTLLLQ